MSELIDDIKHHPGLAAIFLATGFVAGLGSFKYLSGVFNLDVVLRDSYVYKTDVEKTFVPKERYAFVDDELKSSRAENDKLKQQNAKLLAAQNAMSVSVCQRYAQETNAVIAEQQRIEGATERALSPYIEFRKKEAHEIDADTRRVQEYRKYSEQLNAQLIQLRGEIGKCGK